MDLLPFLPADPQVSSGEKAGHGVSGQVMDPSFSSQLGHDGVDEGETGPSLCKINASRDDVRENDVVVVASVTRDTILIPPSKQSGSHDSCPSPLECTRGCPPSC